MSRVNTPACRPNRDSSTRRKPSSSPSTAVTVRTGPNTSQFPDRLDEQLDEPGVQRPVDEHPLPEPVAQGSCLYTSTPDEDFVLDRIGPVVVASPCSGHGAKFAALIGELAADLAVGAGGAVPRFALSRAHSRV
jgi:glycine/D-amino acid oxidase-like deaminating enzyme